MDHPATSSPIGHPAPYEIISCADCGAEGPQWASINKGILICNDCCMVHRSLGRQISHVRSLKKGLWDSAQLQLVNLLHRLGSNRIWEHAFLDPSMSGHKKLKKPTANDAILPTKETFIKAKYVDLAFTLKPSKDDSVNQDDLNKQLWACVRTGHVDTVLRLIATGADPNYQDPDSGNSPLHIAAKENQPMQVELLAIYGADPSAVNNQNLNPSQLALQENHTELSQRLEELQFEVTNRLSMFLCGRKPEHKGKDHFLIPEMAGHLDGHRTIKKQLETTSDLQFEKLAQDVYDEADRRQTHASWIATTQGRTILSGSDQYVAVFLPLNPKFSATRNQLRQKLAKYDDREFAVLVIDILKESKRRFLGDPLPEESADALDISGHFNMSRASVPNDSHRDYDEVPESFSRENCRASGVTRSSGPKTRSTDSMDAGLDQRNTLDDILELKERVGDTEGKIKTLTGTSQKILQIVSQLQNTMENLRADNASLKTEVFKLNEQLSLARRQSSPATAHAVERASSLAPEKERNAIPPFGRTSVPADVMENRASRRHGSITNAQTIPLSRSNPSGRISLDQKLDKIDSRETPIARPRDRSREMRPDRHFHDSDYATVSPPPVRIQDVFSGTEFPDCLVRETEKLTGAIRDLLQDAQKRNLLGKASDHAHRIASLINQIILLIPQDIRHGNVEATIAALKDATTILSAKCNAPNLDTEDTCHAAYSVAQGAKNLLIIFHN